MQKQLPESMPQAVYCSCSGAYLLALLHSFIELSRAPKFQPS